MALYYLSDQAQDVLNGRKKRGGKKLKKFALAPARGSFLLLVRLNFLGLAKKLSMAIQKNPNAVMRWWNKLGGDYSKLEKAVRIGKDKPIFKKKSGKIGDVLNDNEINELAESSLAGVSIAAAISSATPIIVSLSKLFKSLGIRLFNKKKRVKPESEPESETEQDEDQNDKRI